MYQGKGEIMPFFFKIYLFTAAPELIVVVVRGRRKIVAPHWGAHRWIGHVPLTGDTFHRHEKNHQEETDDLDRSCSSHRDAIALQ